MATITLTIPANEVARVTDALCASSGLVSSPANAKAALVSHIKSLVQAYERAQAKRAARAAAEAAAVAAPDIT